MTGGGGDCGGAQMEHATEIQSTVVLACSAALHGPCWSITEGCGV